MREPGEGDFGRGEYCAHEHESSHHFEVPEDSPNLVGIVLLERGIKIAAIPIGDLSSIFD